MREAVESRFSVTAELSDSKSQRQQECLVARVPNDGPNIDDRVVVDKIILPQLSSRIID